MRKTYWLLLSPDGDGGAGGGVTPVPVTMANLGGGSPAASADPGPDLSAMLRQELGGAAPDPAAGASSDPGNPDPSKSTPAAPAKPEASKPASDDPYALPAKRKPAAAAPDPAKPAEKLTGAAALRAELETAKAELAALKSGKPAGTPAAAAGEPEEVKTLRQQIEDIRAQVKAREEVIHRVSYKESAEFKEKYVAPYHAEFKAASEYLAQVPLADGSRNGTSEDLARLMRTAPAELGRVASEMFGDNAAVAIAYRNQVAMKLNAMRSAEAEAATRGQQLKQQEEESHRQAIEETRRTFQDLTKKEMSDEEVWSPDPADPETKVLLDRGQKLVKEVFENPDNLPREVIVQRMAKVAARAAGFDNLYHRHQKLAEKHAELEVELAKYRGAEPPVGGSGGRVNEGGNRGGYASLADELRETLSGSRR